MSWLIRCAGDAAGGHVEGSGQFLEDYDPDWMPSQMTARQRRNAVRSGRARWTPDINKAMRFETSDAAVACWRTQSRVLPLRPDGHPNRPLTAYTIELVELQTHEGTP